MKIEIADNILSDEDLFNIQIKGYEDDWQGKSYSAFNRYNSMKVDGKDIYPNPNLRNKYLEFIINKEKCDEIISTIKNIFKDQNIYKVSIKVEEFDLDNYSEDYIFKATNGDIS